MHSRDMCIYQAMSANDMQHHPRSLTTLTMSCVYRLGDIGHGLHTLSKQHQPTIGNISQGFHASDVVCGHGKWSRTMTCCIIQGKQNHWMHSHIIRGACASSWQHHRWPMISTISQGLCTSGKRYRQKKGNINQGMYSSCMTSSHLATDIGQRNTASVKAYMHLSGRFYIGWATFSSANVNQY